MLFFIHSNINPFKSLIMRKLNLLSLITIAVTFILSSCSMEKRVYLSGYNIDFKNSLQNKDKEELVKNVESNETSTNKRGMVKNHPVISSFISSSNNKKADFENNVTASSDKSEFILAHRKIDLNKKINKVLEGNSNLVSHEPNSFSNLQNIKEKITIQPKSVNGATQPSNSILFGIIGFVLGLVLMMVGGPLLSIGLIFFGLILMLTGIILLSVGLIKLGFNKIDQITPKK